MPGINPLSSISEITTGISSATGLLGGVPSIVNLIVAIPQLSGYSAQTKNGGLEAPMLFHFEGEQTFSFQSEITDYSAQDNTSIQDHISLAPVEVTTKGFIGELTDVPPNRILAIAKIAATKLTSVAGYLPSLSLTALIAYNEAAFAYAMIENTFNTAVDTFDSIATGGAKAAQNKQQTFFHRIYDYWQKRRLFTIQTPWQVMPDMAIKSVRVLQEADTDSVSTFEVTFKKMNFVSSVQLSQTSDNRQSQATAALVNGGTGVASPATTTVSDTLTQLRKQ